MHRRRFITQLATSAAAAPLLRAAVPAPGEAGRDRLIDTNVYLSSWAVRRASPETAGQLVAKLRHHGVTTAWTGSFEGVLHSDLAAVNARLAEACTRDGGGVLLPFGTVNPTLPDWEDDLRRCHEVHRMPGVRVFPNYHGYGLDDPRFARLVDLAGQRRRLVQVVLCIEDDRSQNPALSAAPVVAAPLADVVERFPQAHVMVLNATSRVFAINSPLLKRLSAAGVWFEIATLETVAGIEVLLQAHPKLRLAFGSHTPYFYFEAALLKLQESALTAEQLDAVRFGHAEAAAGGAAMKTG
jgi:uncharacterized protein